MPYAYDAVAAAIATYGYGAAAAPLALFTLPLFRRHYCYAA